MIRSALPESVRIELALRKTDADRPTDQTAIAALREHFLLAGGQQQGRDGFIDLLEQLGGTPESSDPLVYDISYNNNPHLIRRASSAGHSEAEFQTVVLPEMLHAHQARVRLLRYQEFIQAQTLQGLGYEDHWYFVSNDTEEPDFLDGEDNDQGEGLTKDQLFVFVKGFTTEFFTYVNRDRMLTGEAIGVKTSNRRIPGAPADAQHFEYDISYCNVFDQAAQLRDRYAEEGRPLGCILSGQVEQQQVPVARAAGNRKKKGKKKNCGGGVSVQQSRT